MTADRQHIFIPWTVQEFEDPVLEFAGAEGVYFQDRQGRRYLDFLSQLFNCNLGHGNRRVIEAIRSQAEQACCISPQLLTAERSLLSEELTALLPGDLDKCMFVNSGSEANELAFIMARMVTGRPKIFAKYRSYHGTTFNTLGTAGDPRRMAVEPGPAGAVRFFDPYCYRCDFGLTYPDCGIHCLKALERQIELENPATVAAVVVEPVTGAAGGFPLPEGYLAGLRDLCDRHGILLIADEVITGFGRTGAWFGVNHDSVVPDLMVMAKGITSGYVPMGAVVVRPRISSHFESRLLPIGSTYAASPLATAAARACLVAYREEGCVDNAQGMGRLLMEELQGLKQKHPIIGDVRGKGLLTCLELVTDRATRQPLAPPVVDAQLPIRIRRQAWAEGLHLLARANLLMIAPPLIVTADQIREGVEKLSRVLSWLEVEVSHEGERKTVPLSPAPLPAS